MSRRSRAPGAKQCVLRVLSAIVEEISYENRFRVVELGMLLGFDWKMKLGFGGFSDGDLKNENGGRKKGSVRRYEVDEYERVSVDIERRVGYGETAYG